MSKSHLTSLVFAVRVSGSLSVLFLVLPPATCGRCKLTELCLLLMLLYKVFRYINQIPIVYTWIPAALDPGESTLCLCLEVNTSYCLYMNSSSSWSRWKYTVSVSGGEHFLLFIHEHPAALNPGESTLRLCLEVNVSRTGRIESCWLASNVQSAFSITAVNNCPQIKNKIFLMQNFQYLVNEISELQFSFYMCSQFLDTQIKVRCRKPWYDSC